MKGAQILIFDVKESLLQSKGALGKQSLTEPALSGNPAWREQCFGGKVLWICAADGDQIQYEWLSMYVPICVVVVSMRRDQS